MSQTAAQRDLVTVIARLCHQGLDAHQLKVEVLQRLNRAVPIEGVFWATVDPATLLPTEVLRVDLPEETNQLFVENEYVRDDVNKFVELAGASDGVRSLWDATHADPVASARYREILEPWHLGDELRAVLRSGDAVWGVICMHRVGTANPFSDDEVGFVRRIASHLAEGLRLSVLMSNVDTGPSGQAPGLILLSRDFDVVGSTPSGQAWLDDLRGGSSTLPDVVYAVAGRLLTLERSGGGAPSSVVRVRTSGGRWAILHASRVSASDDTIAVIVEESAPAELAPLIADAHGLTPREQQVTREIVLGRSTRDISDRLQISTNTVQDHLKSIFDKTGVRSRRELVTLMLGRHHLQNIKAGRHVGPRGQFDR